MSELQTRVIMGMFAIWNIIALVFASSWRRELAQKTREVAWLRRRLAGEEDGRIDWKRYRHARTHVWLMVATALRERAEDCAKRNIGAPLPILREADAIDAEREPGERAP